MIINTNFYSESFKRMQTRTKKIISLIVSIICAVVFVCSGATAEQVQTYTVADGLVDPIVPVIFQDSRGALWFGSDSGGVSRFYDNTFKPYVGSLNTYEDVEAGALLGQTQQIVEDKWGHIWFLTWVPSEKSGRVSRFDGTSVSYVGTGNSIITDRHGDIWIGENHVLTQYVTPSADKRPQPQPHEIIGEDLIRSTTLTISVVFESTDGTFWLGGSEGETVKNGVILSFRGNRWGRGPAVPGDGENTGDETEVSTPRIHPNAGFTRHALSDLNVVSPVEAIAEDSAGNLWFGGDNLLLRFDGTDFEQILPTWSYAGRKSSDETSLGRLAAIKVDAKGDVWFTDDRPTRRWDGSGLRTPENIYGFLQIEDKWKNLWFISENRGVRQYNSNLELLLDNANSRLENDEIKTIFEAVDGKLWFGHNNGVTVLDPTPAVIIHTKLGTSRVRTMYEDSRGYLWFSVPGAASRYDAKVDEIRRASFRLNYGQNKIATESRVNGRNFVPSESEIVKIFEVGTDIWFINEPIVRGTSTRYTFFRDVNGNYGPRISISIRTEIGPGGERSDSDPDVLLSEGKHVWMAFGGHLFKADTMGLLWITERESQRILFQKISETDAGVPTLEIDPGAVPITDLYRDSEERLWVHFANGSVKRYPKDINLAGSNTRPIVPDVLQLKATHLVKSTPKNKWYFNAVTGKLIRWSDIESGKPIILDGESSTVPLAVWQSTEQTDSITFIFSDVLKTYHGKMLRTVDPIDPIDTVNASIVSRDGILWLATSHGAVRYDGKRFRTYTRKEDGFLVDNVHDVIEDSRGNIWFATRGGGAVRYDGETFHSRTTKNGWAHNNISKILESFEKDIWFATEGGVTQYTPARGGLPECRITSLEADKLYSDFSSSLVLTTHSSKIFNIRGLSSLREGLSYQFKLIGLDTSAWMNVSADDFMQLPTVSTTRSDKWIAFPGAISMEQQTLSNSAVIPELQNQNGVLRIRYTGLKAGHYTFLVKAFRKDWPYTALPAIVDFTIPPPIWTRWRTFLPTLIFVTVVFALVGRLILNRRHTIQLRNEMREKEETEMQRIRAELSEAQDIQMGLLPTESPDMKGFEVAGMSVPATQVGGDFYDYLTVENGQTAIAVADAAGKGLRGAMNAVLTNGMLYEVSRYKSEAAVILSDLNAGLSPRMYGPSFIALNLAILDETNKKVDYANGGQPYPILKRGSDIIEIENSDLPLGSMKRVVYESSTIELSDGDALIFHTDGLIEALNTAEEMYGTERFKELVSQMPDNFSAEEIIEHIVDDVHEFVGDAEQYDDLTIVVIKRRSNVQS